MGNQTRTTNFILPLSFPFRRKGERGKGKKKKKNRKRARLALSPGSRFSGVQKGKKKKSRGRKKRGRNGGMLLCRKTNRIGSISIFSPSERGGKKGGQAVAALDLLVALGIVLPFVGKKEGEREKKKSQPALRGSEGHPALAEKKEGEKRTEALQTALHSQTPFSPPRKREKKGTSNSLPQTHPPGLHMTTKGGKKRKKEKKIGGDRPRCSVRKSPSHTF